MIQDIMPKRFYNQYCPKDPEPRDTVFFFREGKILAGTDEHGFIRFPEVKDLHPEEGGEPADRLLRYLFRIDEKACYLCEPDSDLMAEEAEGWQYHPLRLLRKSKPKEACFAAMTAWHLYVWYRDNRCCGRCGKALVHDPGERLLVCPSCGNHVYPRISPAVIVGVTDQDRILMTRYAGREHKGNALIAGFCEIGETAEETVRREVMEEVGLKVKNIRYYKSQPWGFAGDLLMGYYCEVDGDRSVRLDEDELESARWVSRSEIGDEPAHVSLTADMIMHFKREVSAGQTEAADIPAHIRGTWYGHTPGIPDSREAYAVVIPLIEREGEYHILFEQRAAGLSRQPGEVCFPGGRVETGESPEEAGLRETAEELLVDTDQIEILSALDAQMGPSGAPVWPFAAVLNDYRDTFSEDEVARVFTIPLSWFGENSPRRCKTELVTRPGEDFPYELIPGGREYPFRRKKQEVIFYETPEAVIWGVTAKITDEFLKKL